MYPFNYLNVCYRHIEDVHEVVLFLFWSINILSEVKEEYYVWGWGGYLKALLAAQFLFYIMNIHITI